MAATIVLALTLPPGRPFEGAPRLLGDRWLSDAILNVLLFVPLGAALGTGLLPTRRLVLGAMVFSAGIESAQLFIPGRDASVPDVACNTMGAALGIALWRGRRRYLSPAGSPSGRRERRRR